MGKRLMTHRSLYSIILLGLCLGGLVVHLFAGDAAHLDAWYSSLHTIEHAEPSDHAEPHDHEDDFTLLTPGSSSDSPTQVIRTTTSDSADSCIVSPMLPPPKAA